MTRPSGIQWPDQNGNHCGTDGLLRDKLYVARSRKEKYCELVEKMEDNGFMVDLVTLEVGSGGFVNYDSFRRLNEATGASKKELQKLLSISAISRFRSA